MEAKALQDKVAVITGASSGIGRATAFELARQGVKIVVAARRSGKLEEVKDQIKEFGSEALAVIADVSDEKQVKNLAKRALSKFGRIDIWVNNAAVLAFGRFEEIPDKVFRRVMDVNFFGTVYGTRAALPVFRRQGYGHLINISSLVGTIGEPYASPYSASKFAIRGFSESLQQELDELGDNRIRVSIVLPSTVDTPFFQHAANYSGRSPKALRPVYRAQDVAEKIVDLVLSPKKEVIIGAAGKIISSSKNFAPGTTKKAFSAQVDKDQFYEGQAMPTEGNLFTPMDDGWGISGGWMEWDMHEAS